MWDCARRAVGQTEGSVGCPRRKASGAHLGPRFGDQGGRNSRTVGRVARLFYQPSLSLRYSTRGIAFGRAKHVCQDHACSD